MKIRPVAAGDRPAILQLARRLAEQGTPPDREQRQVRAADEKSIGAAMDSPSPLAELLVAESDGQVLGFVHVKTVVDYYTQEQIGHVSDLVVAAHAEGRGLGRALLDAAQAWAVGRGYSMMQLFVLPENSGARALYEGAGYRAEWIKYVRALPATRP